MSQLAPAEPIVIARADLPAERDWLAAQARVVIAYGAGPAPETADVLAADLAEAESLAARTVDAPFASLALMQVLRNSGLVPLHQALVIESLAYSSLQGGPEFAAWLRSQAPPLPAPDEQGDPIVLVREGVEVRATLNRPANRNALSVEMRDAWIGALQLLLADDSIECLTVRGAGPCFSVGGDLREFGSFPDTMSAHWLRMAHSPAALLAQVGGRVRMHLHGACLGSGVELSAFADHLSASSQSFFQLPELRMGLIPGAGGTVSIARRIGRHRMAAWALSGRRISAREALTWGLLDQLQED